MEAKLLTPETWTDFETFFKKYHGVRGGCWCVYHLCSSSDFQHRTKPERKDYHQQMVARKATTGLLLYADGEPVAWCQFGKADVFEQINRSRAYKSLNLPIELKPDWRITCIFVDKKLRRQKLSNIVLAETLKVIALLGGGIVEAFPLFIPGQDKPQYSGTVRQYLELGFEKAADLGSRVLMRKQVMPILSQD